MGYPKIRANIQDLPKVLEVCSVNQGVQDGLEDRLCCFY